MTDPAYSEQSSPFLDLPTELRELILVKYYENSSLIVVTHRQNRIERPRVAGVPSLNIERACKALLKESLAVRRKHITQNLIVKDSYFVYCGMNSFCYSTKFKWVRKHITSIQLSLVLNIFMLPYWPSLVNGFPNLKNLEFQVSIQVALPASRTRRYMPLDEGKNQRGLAEDVVKGDWDNDCARSTIKSKLHDIETVYHRARDRSARDSMNYFRLSREESTIRVKISTRAVNEQSNHLHDAVTMYKSKGHQEDRQLYEENGLIVLSKTCQIDTIEETAEMQVEDETEKELKENPGSLTLDPVKDAIRDVAKKID